MSKISYLNGYGPAIDDDALEKLSTILYVAIKSAQDCGITKEQFLASMERGLEVWDIVSEKE